MTGLNLSRDVVCRQAPVILGCGCIWCPRLGPSSRAENGYDDHRGPAAVDSEFLDRMTQIRQVSTLGALPIMPYCQTSRAGRQWAASHLVRLCPRHRPGRYVVSSTGFTAKQLACVSVKACTTPVGSLGVLITCHALRDRKRHCILEIDRTAGRIQLVATEQARMSGGGAMLSQGPAIRVVDLLGKVCFPFRTRRFLPGIPVVLWPGKLDPPGTGITTGEAHAPMAPFCPVCTTLSLPTRMAMDGMDAEMSLLEQRSPSKGGALWTLSEARLARKRSPIPDFHIKRLETGLQYA